MKKVLVLFLIIVVFVKSYSQIIDNKYNFSNHNPTLLNPAFMSIDKKIDLYLGQRIQWIDLTNSPENFVFAVSSPVYDNMAIGLKINNQSLGIFRAFTFNFRYSYNFLISKNHNISLGLDLNYVQNNVNISSLYTEELQDPALYSPSLLQNNFYNGFGIMYNFKDFYFGASSPIVYNIRSGELLRCLNSQVYYDFYINNKKYLIQPYILTYVDDFNLKYVDFKMKFEFKNKVFIQTGYRTLNEMSYSVGFIFNSVGFAYCYEHGLNTLSYLSKGSHEIALFFKFNTPKIDINNE
ncbi:MAG: hypothetical protein Kow0068_03940 [Marinilabiliales bacterium]